MIYKTRLNSMRYGFKNNIGFEIIKYGLQSFQLPGILRKNINTILFGSPVS